MRTRINGRWVVEFEAGDHRVIPDGVVVYEDDEILHVGTNYEGRVDKTINVSDHLVAPGIVNLHCVANTDLQMLGIDIESPVYPESMGFWDDSHEVLNKRLTRASVRHALVQALEMGSTTIGAITTMATKRWEDPPYEPQLIAETMEELGVRGYAAHQFHSGSHRFQADALEATWNDRRGERGLRRAVDFVEQLRDTGSERVQGYIFPYTLDSCSSELFQAAKAEADRLDTHLRTHFAQSEREIELLRDQHGTTPVEYLDDLGIIDDNLILTHALYIGGYAGTPYPDGRELDLLANRDVTVSHEPVVFARRGKFLESFSRYLDHGVNMSLGTDTYPQDAFSMMRCAAGACNVVEGQPDAITPHKLFEAATLGGAQALGRDDIGRLTPGAKPDIICVNFSHLHTGTIEDPIRNLVTRCYGPDVDRVIVDGQTVVENGSAVGADGNALKRDTVEVLDRFVETFVEWDSENRSQEELFPPAFEVTDPPQ